MVLHIDGLDDSVSVHGVHSTRRPGTHLSCSDPPTSVDAQKCLFLGAILFAAVIIGVVSAA